MRSGDWIYWLIWLGVAVLYVSMIYLAWWALFSDRGKGRRCPKCWYDMDYSLGMRCSECGYEAKGERELHRTKRRYGYALLAIAVCLVTAAAIQDRALRHGWVGMTPTRVLLVALPIVEGERGPAMNELLRRFSEESLSDANIKRLVTRCVNGDPWARPPEETWRRKYGYLIAQWRHYFASQARQDDNERAEFFRDLEAMFLDLPPRLEAHTRQVWPEGVMPTVQLRHNDWWPIRSEIRMTIEQLETDAPPQVIHLINTTPRRSTIPVPLHRTGLSEDRATIRVISELRRGADASDWQVVDDSTVDLSWRTTPRLEDVLEPVHDEQIDQLMRATFQGGAVTWERGPRPLRFRYQPAHTISPTFDGVAIGVDVELVRGEDIARRLQIWWLGGTVDPDDENRSGIGQLRHLGWAIDHEDLSLIREVIDNPSEWELRIRSNPKLALRAGGAKRYWSGSFTLPVRLDPTGGEAPPPDWWTPGELEQTANP